ncbi:hypothetical protein JCM10207_007395 [Rhodosporidiobolus poonsookiae]
MDTASTSGTSSQTHSPRPSVSAGKMHVRRRSIGIETPDVVLNLDSADDDDDYFREKRSDSTYSRLTNDDSYGEDDPLTGGVVGNARWRASGAATAGPKKSLRKFLLALAMVAIGICCWLAGLATGDGTIQRATGTGARNMVNGKKESEGRLCNPYSQYGVLNVNSEVATENMWEPIAAPDDCQPINFMELLRQAQYEHADVKELDFVRNRTIAILGDSVDRDHNEHFCQFVGGWHEMIGVDHPMSPPYPPGQELPPEDYKSYFTGAREWPNYGQSRPYVCHVEALNFRILNVFHYGFRNATDFIEHHPHYYPPATVEDRLDQIVVPLIRSLSENFGTSPTPDILSVAPGFWGLLRQSVEDQRLAQEATEQGVGTDEINAKYDVWRVMSEGSRRWNEKRITEILRHAAKAWKGERDGAGRRTPMLLWRALHFVKETDKIPYNRLIALDQVGRSVVDRLIAEGKAAEAGAQRWSAWTKSVGAKYLGLGKGKEGENEALEGGLGRRLKIDEWGSLMLGQSRHFRDEVHPLPLPGSYLYGNMLLQQLRMKVADEERVRLSRERE